MAVNQRTFSKAIVNDIYNSRAISKLGSNSQPRCVTYPDGNMDALIVTTNYNSTDNGYNWTNTGFTYGTFSLNYPYGPRTFMDSKGYGYHSEGGRLTIYDPFNKSDLSFYLTQVFPSYSVYDSIVWKDEMFYLETGGKVFCIFSSLDARLEIVAVESEAYSFDPTRSNCLGVDNIAWVTDGSQWFPKFSALDNGNDILILGTKFTLSSNTLSLVRFTKGIDYSNGTFNRPTDLYDSTFDTQTGYNMEGLGIINPGLAKDGSGIIGAVFEVTNHDGTSSSPYYMYSSNNGGSFSVPKYLDFPSGYTANIDGTTGKADSHIDIIGNSDGGFLISSVFQDSTGKADIFVINADSITVTSSGTESTTTSGTWTAMTTGVTTQINDIVELGSGTKEFYAVGNNGTIIGTIGDVWYSGNSITSQNLNEIKCFTSNSGVITYSGSIPISTGYLAVNELYAVGEHVILKSNDGISWTSGTGATFHINSITTTSGLSNGSGVNYTHVYGATLGTIGRSTNGVDFNCIEVGQFALSVDVYGVAWNNKCLVVVGASGSVNQSGFMAYEKSNEATEKYYYNIPIGMTNKIPILRDVCYGNNTFLAVGDKGTMWTNPTGSGTWVTQTSGTAYNLQSCRYLNNKFVVVGDSGYYATSTTGSGSWTATNIGTGRNLKGGFYISDLSIVTSTSGFIGYSGTFYTTPTDAVISGNTSNWAKINSNEFTLPDKILGAQFVKYTNRKIPKFGDYSNIFVIYNAGLQNSLYGGDSVENYVYLETVANGSSVPSVSGGGSTRFPGTPYSGTAFTNNLIDFYASGYIDSNTQLYIDKINDLGFTVDFTRWDPIQGSQINNKLGYSVTSTTSHTCLIDPGSFGYGAVARGDTEFNEYMERDSRKLFFKPDLFLSRNYVLTKGGYLKKTIWTLRLFGNDYEIAQIVPRFLGNAILYYEANLYVVGPNNDIYSKLSLPSET